MKKPTFYRPFDSKDAKARAMGLVVKRLDRISFESFAKMVDYIKSSSENYLLNLMEFCRMEISGKLPEDRKLLDTKGWDSMFVDELCLQLRYKQELQESALLRSFQKPQSQKKPEGIDLDVPHNEFLNQYRALEAVVAV